MTSPHGSPMVTAFRGHELLAAGALRDVAQVVWRAVKGAEPQHGSVLVFDDVTARVIDLEMRGDEAAMLAHLDAMLRANAAASAEHVDSPDTRSLIDSTPRPRGRPKLGVVAREITLLPRHWEWLAAQPGGASVAIRKLVDAARRAPSDDDRAKAARDVAYRFMNAMAGDLPEFEEVIRALYRGDEARVRELMQAWPRDIRAYSARLAFPETSTHDRAR
ncbi:MAG: DUF2239 family protein [Gemmatimonas sp.]